MLSILINAYACSPNMGSEPGMAWNWCINLARYCELHIITEGEFRDKIEAALPTLSQGKNMHFYYNPVSNNIRKMCWNQGDWRFYHYYKKWQYQAYEIALKIINATHIDIVHQLNMIGFREPGYLWKIENKPFIWGPIAGIGTIPYSFLNSGGFKSSAFFLLKNYITNIQLCFSPRVYSALHYAKHVITATPEAKDCIKKYHGIETVLINETGCTLNQEPLELIKNNTYFDIVWVGRFIYTKQLKLALETIAKIQYLNNIRFHIIGQSLDSFVDEKYRKYAEKLNINNKCIWHGKISREEVQNIMRESDLLFFTSVAEGTPHVVLEAIANQLPVICFNTCGHGDSVNELIGIKIELSNPKQSIEEFAKKIDYLYHNREILHQMSVNCIERQQELSWDRKAEYMVELYKKTLNDKK